MKYAIIALLLIGSSVKGQDTGRIMVESDGFAGPFPDTVKWKPSYHKKKYHNITSNMDLIVKGKDVQLGGMLHKDTAILRYGKGLTMHTPTITIDSMQGDKIFYTSGYRRDLWLPVPYSYPWWKKVIWVFTGVLLTLIFLFFRGLISESKN